MKDLNKNIKGYKHTAVGWIPKEWHAKPFKEIVEINSNSLNCKIEDNYSFYYLDLSSIDEGKISFPKEQILFKNAPSRARRLLKENDIIMSTVRPNLRGFAIANFDTKSYVCSTGFAILSPKLKEDSLYIYQNLFSHNIWKQIENFVVGSNYPALNNDDVENLLIPYPENDNERCLISKILSIWDKAIETTQNLITAKEQLEKGFMQQLLTEKKHLPGFNGEWKEVRIGEIVKEVKRPIEWDDNKLYNLISVRRRSGGVFFRESLYGHQILTKGLFIANSGDFLISKMQIVHGASGLVKKEYDGMYISGSYIALHSKDDNKLDIEFFDWLSKTREFYHLCFTSSYGVHIEKMTFDFQDFLQRYITIPGDIKEQKKIVLILNTIVDEINLLKSQLELYRQQKKGLMQVLLTGTVRVKV